MKAPAFQLYAGDFFVDTIYWSNEELGAYTRLLSLEWTNGPLPSDEKKLAQAVGLSGHNWKREWDRIWKTISSKFTQICLINVSKMSQNGLNLVSHLSQLDQSLLVNIRLEETRGKQLNYSEIQRKKINKRWVETNTPVIPQNENGIYSPSPSPSPTQILLKEYATFSEKWWQAYPSRNGKKVGKRDALIYLKSMKLQNGNRELLLKATENYSNSKAALEGFVKDPIRFLKKDFWRDWIEPEPEQQKDWC
jgi:hypothetical protein